MGRFCARRVSAAAPEGLVAPGTVRGAVLGHTAWSSEITLGANCCMMSTAPGWQALSALAVLVGMHSVHPGSPHLPTVHQHCPAPAAPLDTVSCHQPTMLQALTGPAQEESMHGCSAGPSLLLQTRSPPRRMMMMKMIPLRRRRRWITPSRTVRARWVCPWPLVRGEGKLGRLASIVQGRRRAGEGGQGLPLQPRAPGGGEGSVQGAGLAKQTGEQPGKAAWSEQGDMPVRLHRGNCCCSHACRMCTSQRKGPAGLL